MKIAILGFGRMGSWLARKLSASHRVAVYDMDRTKPASGPFTRLGRIGEIEGFAPDFLINAVSLDRTVEAFGQAAPYLPKECILADLGSIKGKVADYYAGAGFRYVSVHPMFGPTFADMDVLDGENAVVITESCDEGRRFFEDFFTRLHVRIFRYSFEEHDRTMAYSLTIPFVSSMIFAACVDAKAVPGTTFTRHMALARTLLAEDDHLLAEILFNPHSVNELARITARLEYLKHIIMAKDEDEARGFFTRLRENIGEGP